MKSANTKKQVKFSLESKYLFVLSHMRSRSSLLSHILGSNPEICGYSESHRNYIGWLSFAALRTKLWREHRCSLRNKYLLDKLLFNRKISDRVLQVYRPKVIVLIRNPRDSIRSLLKMGRSNRIEWHRDPEAVCQYYCASMLWLQCYADKLREKFLFVESDSLIESTHQLLNQLTSWLNLKVPLSPKYSVFKNSGKAWHGDPSHNIRSGLVRRTSKHSDVFVPPSLLDQAELAYLVCKDRLSRMSVILSETSECPQSATESSESTKIKVPNPIRSTVTS